MAGTGHDKGGRRSKGDRRLIGSRMPVADAEKLLAVAQAEGITVSDYVAELVADHLRNVQIDQINNQETLPIAQAS